MPHEKKSGTLIPNTIHPDLIRPDVELPKDTAVYFKSYVESSLSSSDGEKFYHGVSQIYIGESHSPDKKGAPQNATTNRIGIADLLKTEELITYINYQFDKSDENSIVNREKIQPACDKINKLLRDNPDVAIRIEGNTDAPGDKEYNQKLSEKRANTISRIILEHIDPELRNRVYVSKSGNGEEKLTEQTEDKSLENRNVKITAEIVSDQTYYRAIYIDSEAQKHFNGQHFDKELGREVDAAFNIEYISGKKAEKTFGGEKGENISSTFVEPSACVVLENIKKSTGPTYINSELNDPNNFALLVRSEDQNRVTMEQKSENEILVFYDKKLVADVKYDLQDKNKHLNSQNINIGIMDSEGHIRINEKDLSSSERSKNMDRVIEHAIKNIDLTKITANIDYLNEPKIQLATTYNINIQQDPNQRGG